MDDLGHTQPMVVTPVEFLGASGGLNGQGVQVVVVTVHLPDETSATRPGRAGAFRPTNMLFDAESATRMRDNLNVAIREAAEAAAEK